MTRQVTKVGEIIWWYQSGVRPEWVTQILEDALLTHNCLSLPPHTAPAWLPFTSCTVSSQHMCSPLLQGSVDYRKCGGARSQGWVSIVFIMFSPAVVAHSARTGVPLVLFICMFEWHKTDEKVVELRVVIWSYNQVPAEASKQSKKG